MVRSWLRDDPLCALPPDDGLVGRVGVALDDDCCDVGGVSTGGGDGDPVTPIVDNPQQHVVIKARQRDGFDVDGNPMFSWTTLVDGPAYWSSERKEFDHVAGMTFVVAKAMVEYGGPERIFETAVLKRVSDETVWRVVGVAQPYGRVELDLRRIEQDERI